MHLYFHGISFKHSYYNVKKIEVLFRDYRECVSMALRPESSENIPILLQEADPYFSNQNDLRNPKMGSKQSVTGPTH